MPTRVTPSSTQDNYASAEKNEQRLKIVDRAGRVGGAFFALEGDHGSFGTFLRRGRGTDGVEEYILVNRDPELAHRASVASGVPCFSGELKEAVMAHSGPIACIWHDGEKLFRNMKNEVDACLDAAEGKFVEGSVFAITASIRCMKEGAAAKEVETYLKQKGFFLPCSPVTYAGKGNTSRRSMVFAYGVLRPSVSPTKKKKKRVEKKRPRPPQAGAALTRVLRSGKRRKGAHLR